MLYNEMPNILPNVLIFGGLHIKSTTLFIQVADIKQKLQNDLHSPVYRQQRSQQGHLVDSPILSRASSSIL